MSNMNAYQSGGFYLSTDGGQNWDEVITNGFVAGDYMISNDNRFLAGTWGYGIRKSEDGGVNWVNTTEGNDFPVLGLIHYDGDTLYSCGNGGVYISTNNGDDWAHLCLEDQMQSVIATPHKLFACDLTEVYSSNRFTDDWSILDNNPLPHSTGDLAWNGEKLFLSGNAGGQDAVYLSVDEGENWIHANGINQFYKIYFGANYMLSASYDGVYLSTDGGLNWSHLGLTNVQAITVYENLVFAGTGYDGIWTYPLSSI
ncbi:MAG: hypothetical protein JEZ03_16055, partial [Bacteroidales bacterium]|nr:hypothetical protein [Bacteroidales bacterium]